MIRAFDAHHPRLRRASSAPSARIVGAFGAHQSALSA